MTNSVAAVILAAGEGARLGSAEGPPKCLRLISGRPLVGWVVRALTNLGIRDVSMVLGSRAEEIAEAIPTFQGAARVRVVECSDWRLGNGRSAAMAKEVVPASADFLLVMADHLIGPDHVRSVLTSAHRGKGCILATAELGAPNIDVLDATKVSAEASGRIVAIGKELAEYNAIDTGVFLMTPKLFPALARAYETGDYSLTGGNRVLAAQGHLLAESIGTLAWQDVDTEADMKAAEVVCATFRGER